MLSFKNNRRRGKVNPIFVSILALLFCVPAAVYFSKKEPLPPREAVEVTGIPVLVKLVNAEVNGKKVERGYVVTMPQWIAVVDTASLTEPDASHGNFEPPFAVPSETFAKLCLIAHQRSEPITLKGTKANREHDGLPVMVVTHVVLFGQKFPVEPYAGH